MASLKGRFAEIGAGKAGESLGLLKNDRAQYMEIPIDSVEPDPNQPRKDLGDLEDLKASIKEHGLVQPLIVSPIEGERFRIIAGERRYTAAKQLGLKTIDCVVRTVEEHQRLEIQLIENIHRKNFNPVEEAQAYIRLQEEFNLSQRQLAKRVARSVATINETIRILSLPSDILEGVRTSEHLSRSVLLEIAKQESEADQRSLWRRAALGNLTVKAAREKKIEAEGVEPLRQVRLSIPTRNGTVSLALVQDESTTDGELIVQALSEALHTASTRFELLRD